MSKKTIYTISSVDLNSEGVIETSVVGSYGDRNSAVRACVDYMVERLHLRPDIRYALMHDEENPEIASVVSETSGISRDDILKMFAFVMDEDWSMPESVEKAVSGVLADVFSITSVYHVSTDSECDIGHEEYLFEIAENELEDLDD